MFMFVVSYHQHGFFHDAVDPDSPTMELLPWIESQLVDAATKNEAIVKFHCRNSFYSKVKIVGVTQV